MNPHHPPYLAYLLRLWQAGEGETPTWRASLESPQNHERRAFDTLEALFIFLNTKTINTCPHAADNPGREKPEQIIQEIKSSEEA